MVCYLAILVENAKKKENGFRGYQMVNFRFLKNQDKKLSIIFCCYSSQNTSFIKSSLTLADLDRLSPIYEVIFLNTTRQANTLPINFDDVIHCN